MKLKAKMGPLVLSADGLYGQPTFLYLRARLRLQGLASTLALQPLATLVYAMPLSAAERNLPQSVPYSQAVKPCQSPIAARRAALFVLPFPVPE